MRAEDGARRLDNISASLEAAQADLRSIRGSVGTGARDLSRDVNKLLKDARKDLRKMRKAVQRDLDRLQRDLGAAAGPSKPAAKRRAAAKRSNGSAAA